ncbi:threonine dehydrogenase and related Zn-dependent dehydrogenases [Streptomyces sp. NL15-2K]|nr:threonine dehydrogenase and related Zn-dependent dehydrogenases [Streptomyces sp. NL15-2K]
MRTLWSGVSRGTEMLAFRGQVPRSRRDVMRAPSQEGDFPGPSSPRAVTPVPDGVPAERAVPASTVETAVNSPWNAAPLVGDRIAVVGGGTVGAR